MNCRFNPNNSRWCFLIGVFLLFNMFSFTACSDQKSDLFCLIEKPAIINPKPEWNRFKILIWPYRTNVIKDYKLYRRLNLGGFQIDHGVGKQDKVNFSISHNYPYYVGHTAGKGILYLAGDNAKAVKGRRGLVKRPFSLANPDVIKKMKGLLKEDISATKAGKVLAYAFDDEISLGSYTSPCDVDIGPDSLAWFRKWLGKEYGTISKLNDQWETRFESFEDVYPEGYDEVRKTLNPLRFKGWNLSAWIDFRHFMDYQFASVLSELTRYANTLDPDTPAGFVGGQAPGPWGGYDYALLSRSVQWMEAYDIFGTNEILRSFWDQHRRPRMQTFFTSGNLKKDTWFLWYYLLNGNQAVIAWPDKWFLDNNTRINPYVRLLAPVFKEVQGPVSEILVNPDTHFDPDPIGIYYSQPSIEASWAMDALADGRSWPNRYSSIDNENQSKGILRQVWCKTLEDLGYQFDFISYLDVKEGLIDLNKRFKVIILPKTMCLSDTEAKALSLFVKNGGTLIADYLCGIMDEHGKTRSSGVLDNLFGIKRLDSAGYLNGRGIFEIDAEKYKKPFLDRFTNFDGAKRYRGIAVYENGTKPEKQQQMKKSSSVSKLPSVIIKNFNGKGRTVYLNLSPLEYWNYAKRFSDYGKNWREIVSSILIKSGLKPRVHIHLKNQNGEMIETLFWKNKKRLYLGIVSNPIEKMNKNDVENHIGIYGKKTDITIEFNHKVKLTNMRTGRHFPEAYKITDRFKPWEGNLYEIQ